MTIIIPGLIAIAMLLVYLGYYVVGIFFVPLTIVVIGALAMAVADLVQTIRQRENDSSTDLGMKELLKPK